MVKAENFAGSDRIKCYYQPHMSNKYLHEQFTNGTIHPMYAEDYDIGFGFRFDTDYTFFAYSCLGTDDEWDNILCNYNNPGPNEWYDYGCATDLMKSYYGNSEGCPKDYVCQDISGKVDTGCCYYNGTKDVTDD